MKETVRNCFVSISIDNKDYKISNADEIFDFLASVGEY